MTSGTSELVMLSFNGASFTGNFLLGGGALKIHWIFNIYTLSTGTNTYTLGLGMTDSSDAIPPANGIYVTYNSGVNSGNWVMNCSAASSTTSSNSSVAATTGWHHLEIDVNAAASSVSFIMDGVWLGSAITTNIPASLPFPPLPY